MSNFSLSTVQEALFSTLRADTLLNDVISGVYDHIPPTAQLPCVVIGDGQERDIANDSGLASRLELTLYAYSAQPGRKEVLAVLQRIHALLHHGSMSLSEGNLVHMRVDTMETRVHQQTGYIEGMLRLVVLVSHLQGEG